jgi:hypothetical protein
MIHIADYYSWKIMDENYEVKLSGEIWDNYKISEVKCEEVISELIR